MADVGVREIIADYKQHQVGERELVNWTRPDYREYPVGACPSDRRTYFDVPIMYLREVTADDYFAQFPHMRGQASLVGMRFWEVSVD